MTVDPVEEVKRYKTWVPPGHFYSPIPDLAEVDARRGQIYDPDDPLLGISLNEEKQLLFLRRTKRWYDLLPFQDESSGGARYQYQNGMFSYGDAISLFLMMAHRSPRRIIEVGSGYSSAVMLDTCELFPHVDAKLTFIEPYPDRLHSLLREDDLADIIAEPVQDVGLEVYDQLEAGDILFIDSTHVSKVGSDVNHIFFNILPRLKPGVLIHIHDIGVNFEYNYEWIKEGRAWTEAYLLRAFLMFNNSFEIRLYNSAITRHQRPYFEEHMPLYLKNAGGSIWLERVN